MVDIDIRVGGASVNEFCLWDRAKFTSVADGNPGDASIVLDNSARILTPGDVRAGKHLELWVDGTRAWDGFVMKPDWGWPFEAEDTSVPSAAPRFVTLNGMDRNAIFGRRFVYVVADPSDRRGLRIWPSGTSDKTALEWAIDNYLSLDDMLDGFDIREVASPSPWEEFTIGFVGAPMGILFEDCSEMTGAVYWVGPDDRKLHYRSDRDVTAPFALSDRPITELGQIGYREMDATLDYSDPANDALVWGAGKGSSEVAFARYTSDWSPETYGLWQWGDAYIGASKQETVQRRARTYVIGSPSHRRGHEEPIPVAHCTIFEPGLVAGHVVEFHAEVYGYQEDLPLRKVEMSFPTPTSVRYDLELTTKVDTPWGVPDPWWLRPYRNHNYREPPQRTPDIPQGPTGDPSASSGSHLIDHFDQATLVAREAIGPILIPHPGGQTTLPITLSVPAGSRPGDTALLTLTIAEGNVLTDLAHVPLGWTLLDQFTTYSEGLGWSFATFSKAVYVSETTYNFWVTVGGDFTYDAEYIAHITTWRGVEELALAKAASAGATTATWPWESEALLVGASNGLLSGFTSVLYTEMQEPNSSYSGTSLLKTGWTYETTQPYGPVPGFGTTTIIAMRAPSPALVLPGPAITGSPYAGGNPYAIDVGDGFVSDSEFYYPSPGGFSGGGFSVRDYYRSVVGSTQGDVTDPEPDLYPETAFSHREMIEKLKFRFDPVTDTAWFYFIWGLSVATLDKYYSDKSIMMFDIYWNRDGPGTTSFIEVGNDAAGNGPDPQWFDTEDFPLVPGDDYYVVFDGGTVGRVRFKIWNASDAEPSDWLADLPYAPYDNVYASGEEDYNEVSVEVGALAAGNTFYLDAWWYGSGSEIPLTAEVTEIPIYDAVTSLYHTTYPYAPSSLIVYYQGMALRPGIDYEEVDPEEGTFQVLSGQELPGLTVKYERSSYVPLSVPGGPYRPALQLQYGWGTPLDGYNCNMACSAMALDRHTLGQYTAYQGTPRSTPPSHRSHQDDQVGGTDLGDAATAWQRGWGQVLQSPGNHVWSEFVRLIEEGRGAILQGTYGNLPPEKRSGDFTGGHSLYINERLQNGNFWGLDPLYRYPMVYTASELQDYAMGLFSAGHVSAAFTGITI